METKKWRGCLLCQSVFWPDWRRRLAHVGFSVEDKPVGPAVLFKI